jgi:ribosome recycling factor
MEEVKKKAKSDMEKALEALKHDLATLRTGRASLGILENIKVEAYGNLMKIEQLATMSIPEARSIAIQPWDPSVISAIEKAILKSDLGLNPANDGKIIRIVIPQLTEERRKEIVKHVHKRVEDAKVAIRNVRRDANDKLKKLEKDKLLSSDNSKDAMAEIQKLTDSYIKKAEEIKEHKDAEIMAV